MIKKFLNAKDPYEGKYQFLINKKESTGLKNLNDSKVFVEYSNHMDDIYKNIKDHNMITDVLSNKKGNPILTKLFIRGRKLNISFIFITQSYIAVSK